MNGEFNIIQISSSLVQTLFVRAQSRGYLFQQLTKHHIFVKNIIIFYNLSALHKIII